MSVKSLRNSAHNEFPVHPAQSLLEANIEVGACTETQVYQCQASDWGGKKRKHFHLVEKGCILSPMDKPGKLAGDLDLRDGR